MTGAVIVAAETLKDEVLIAEQPQKDEATASQKESEVKKAKIVVAGDGSVTIENGASSLVASALSMIAIASIIY